ncbi:Sel1l protein [Capsaspora owczarzaki ATCC 30864]|uniref:Sel1l protein n=1 Tax=Capsaspora owczarzaki (strain ATCC 30864) TaxID=595528 RepID=UPI000352591D|nr:Sel1l protein [Capsaspora owczarzaki ATCC 30864]|eukprot:XP_004363784.2 Sel1l protein [Capsaspora owczarzaki ATCC 30864]
MGVALSSVLESLPLGRGPASGSAPGLVLFADAAEVEVAQQPPQQQQQQQQQADADGKPKNPAVQSTPERAQQSDRTEPPTQNDNDVAGRDLELRVVTDPAAGTSDAVSRVAAVDDDHRPSPYDAEQVESVFEPPKLLPSDASTRSGSSPPSPPPTDMEQTLVLQELGALAKELELEIQTKTGETDPVKLQRAHLIGEFLLTQQSIRSDNDAASDAPSAIEGQDELAAMRRRLARLELLRRLVESFTLDQIVATYANDIDALTKLSAAPEGLAVEDVQQQNVEVGKVTADSAPPETPAASQNLASDTSLDAQFHLANAMVNKTGASARDINQGYTQLAELAKLGHRGAQAAVARVHLFGHPQVTVLEHNVPKAVEMYKALAEQGDAEGHFGLGFLHSIGVGGITASQAVALVHYTFAALGGNPQAQMALGFRYMFGVGVEASCETAVEFYKQVAERVAHESSIVRNYQMKERHRLSATENEKSFMSSDFVQYYQYNAERGDVTAQGILGQIYYQGHGVPQSFELARRYFEMAAANGDITSKAHLGQMHFLGQGVPQNNVTALKYFREASAKVWKSDGNDGYGCHEPTTGMGVMSLYGYVLAKDTSMALQYFQQAAETGFAEAQLHLGNLYFRNVLAIYNLGVLYHAGVGTATASCDMAIAMYKNVAERGRSSDVLEDAQALHSKGRESEAFLSFALASEIGFEIAQSNAAFLIESDTLEEDYFRDDAAEARAFMLYRRSALQGNGESRVKVGDFYYHGQGVGEDLAMAATQYRLAAEQQHNPQAMFNIGYMYENGIGLPKDFHLAKRYYDLALSKNEDAFYPATLALGKLYIHYLVDSARGLWTKGNPFVSASADKAPSTTQRAGQQVQERSRQMLQQTRQRLVEFVQWLKTSTDSADTEANLFSAALFVLIVTMIIRWRARNAVVVVR